MALSLKYYTTSVNGIDYVQTGPDVPSTGTERTRQEAVSILTEQLQHRDAGIRAFAQKTLSSLPQEGAPSGYTIGPNGNLMLVKDAENYMPSPQESAQGIRGTGQYAGKTYEQVNQPTLQQAPTQPLAGANMESRDLKQGDTGADVQALQQWLVQNGFMTQADYETGPGIYGPKTKAAVLKLQQQLPGLDYSSGPGAFGPKTKAALQSQGVSIQSVTSGAGVDNGNTSGVNINDFNQSMVNGSIPGGTNSSALYDTLISKDPLLSEYFKDQNTMAEFNNLPDELKGTYLQMAQAATKAIEAGKVINPELVQVSPAQLQEFYSQAETELDPYYKEQFGLLKGDLERSVGRLTEDYQKTVSRSEEPFRQGLQDQSQIEAEQGTTYSSERNRREAATILGRNQQLGDLAQGVQRSAQDLGLSYEKTAGSDLARSLNLPSIQDYQTSSTGAYTPSATRSLYIPLGSVTGTGQRERTTALKTRQNELEADYRKSRSLDLMAL